VDRIWGRGYWRKKCVFESDGRGFLFRELLVVTTDSGEGVFCCDTLGNWIYLDYFFKGELGYLRMRYAVGSVKNGYPNGGPMEMRFEGGCWLGHWLRMDEFMSREWWETR